jgi:hypothetical protein
MPIVPRTYSATEVAGEAACPEARVRWLTGLRLIAPDKDGRFTLGAVLAVKMASALLESGVPAESIERAATEGLLTFQRTDEYLPYEPGPRSGRTFAEFQLDVYLEHYNRERPYRGLELGTPIDSQSGAGRACGRGPVERRDLLGGLIHEYSKAAA